MFRVTSEMRPFLKKINSIPGALQKVTARTLTSLAAQANAGQVGNTKKRVKVRTTYTTNSMKTYRASESKPIARQNSVVGTISKYMAFQNDGGKTKSETGGRMPVPTDAVRGSDRLKNIPRNLQSRAMGKFGVAGNKFFILEPHGKNPLRKSIVLIGNVKRRRSNYNKVAIFGKSVGVGKKKNGKRAQKRAPYSLSMAGVFWRKSKRRLIRVRNLKSSGYQVKGVHFHDDAVKRVWTEANVSSVFSTVAGRVLK